jgi:reverse transcriptase-like protein
MPGGRLPTRGELGASVKAGRRWARTRDLPDPAGWKDFASQPELFWERANARLTSDRFPIRAHVFPLPKPGDGERSLTWLDPFDEAILRVVVGRAAPAIGRACKREVVFSYVLAGSGPGWSTERPAFSNRRRREAATQRLDDQRCSGLGTLDVANYYPTIKPKLLSRVLIELGSPVGAARTIASSLEALRQAGAPSGLPLGFEGSGLLGNAVLVPADEAIHRRKLAVIRYTDDSWVFLEDLDVWQALLQDYAVELNALGLTLNSSKTKLHTKAWGDPCGVISRSEFDYSVADQVETSDERALAILERACSDRIAMGFVAVRYALGSLQSQKSALAVPLLEERPWVLEELPVATGGYLLEISRQKRTRKCIDRDWIVDRATCPRDDRGLAAQLHACRVASELRVGRSQGDKLLSLASDSDGGHAPLRCSAASAWGRSSTWSHDTAVQAAEASGDLNVRRSFVLSLRGHQDRTTRAACNHLLRVEPDLSPTLATVRPR